jgi:acid phosphatase type 7
MIISIRFEILRRTCMRLFILFCCVWLTDSSQVFSQDLSGLFLSWQHDPTTTMTINWVDIYEDSSRTVWHRKRGDADWNQSQAEHGTMGPTTLQVRRVELTGLTPDTTYEFGIGNQPEDASHFWRFRTLPATLNRPIRFVEGGDMMHTRGMMDKMAKQMQELDPDFALLGGDLAYANLNKGSRWIDWLGVWMSRSVAKNKRLIPLVVLIGNHEVQGGYGGKPPEDASYFYGLFPLPDNRAYYALDFGNYLSLLLMDSNHTNPVSGVQTEWLREAIEKRSGQTFLFAAYHFPAYGTTKAPENGLPIDAPLAIEIRKHWVPLFERFGVTAVFEHDHHNFKRTHRLRNHQRDDENGILYLGDGAWGVEPRDVPKPEVGWWLAKAEPRNHLWLAEIRSDKTALLQAIDDEGTVFDEVLIPSARTLPE